MLPIISVICFVGAYVFNYQIFDMGIVVFFGVITYFMQKADIPRTPIVLGFVLGPIVEVNLRRALMISRLSILPLFTRPIPAFFMFITIVSIGLVIYKNMRKKEQNII